MFPINICRNIAKNYSQTKFVMVSDIQLIPSKELASKFITMLTSTNAIKPHSPSRVFVVPVFEIELYDIIPKTKDELLMMVKKEKAVYFHRYICSHCQKFPGLKTWLESAPANSDIKVKLFKYICLSYNKFLAICFGKKRISIPSVGAGLYWKQARSCIQWIIILGRITRQNDTGHDLSFNIFNNRHLCLIPDVRDVPYWIPIYYSWWSFLSALARYQEAKT